METALALAPSLIEVEPLVKDAALLLARDSQPSSLPSARPAPVPAQGPAPAVGGTAVALMPSVAPTDQPTAAHASIELCLPISAALNGLRFGLKGVSGSQLSNCLVSASEVTDAGTSSCEGV
eukprot:717481-Pleurochrysis_carterae.AAC.1